MHRVCLVLMVTTAATTALYAAPMKLPVEGVALRGTMGEGLPIQMNLVAAGSSTKVTGAYFYEKTDVAYVPVGLQLEGTLDKAGHLTLTETDEAGKKTGRFTGTISGGSLATLRCTGTWARPDGSGKRTFSLAVPAQSNLRWKLDKIERTVKRPRPGYTVGIQWPVFSGATDAVVLNKIVAAASKVEAQHFEKEMKTWDPVPSTNEGSVETSSEIMAITGKVLSVRFADYFYYSGAAHPGHATRVVNCERGTGKAITLGALFSPGSDYLNVIAQHCRTALRKELMPQTGGEEDTGRWINEGTAPKAQNYARWSLAPHGLIVAFDEYQVGPYAIGARDVVIPWTLLKPVLRTNGPTADFVK
jgi:hypothetical protein